MRFIHTADWQLGMTRHFLNDEAQPRYSAARRDAVAGLGALVAEVGAEFVVVAGDVFEHNQLAPGVVAQSLEAMRGIGVPVYLLPGNHDPLDAGSVYTSPLFTAQRPDNVVVLDRDGVIDVRPGVQIVSAPWRSKRPTVDLLGAALADLTGDGTIRIAVGHGGVDIFEPDREKASQIRLATVEAALERRAVHYVALGDKHSRMQVGGSGRVWYSGSPEVTNYDHVEPDSGHVLVVDVDEDDAAHPVQVDARRVGRWRFLTLRHTVDSARDVTDLDINLDNLTDKERTVVQVGLTGTLSVTDMAALDECVAKYSRLFAALTMWDKETDVAVLPAEGEFDDLGVGGFAAAAVDELVTLAAAGGARSEDAQAALALLRRIVDRGSAA
ncbi:metallophosphoesterase family protein [Mycolicibacterium arenosum]|uniref:Nuclease SbcCD subunit D n=1 Tax=Mycolicibacterium arenosum TaxID=2952157 RepID=A0ABT1LXJ3_9MYCO|nr:exonuclease SbcCD subunit D [Mycolicibacterium sp. CAU 1645]MCP9271065.1 exonuclease SbcCD subunit D [Mycolicibacterium sp. CAU 1645]